MYELGIYECMYVCRILSKYEKIWLLYVRKIFDQSDQSCHL